MTATQKQISYLNSLIKGRFANLGEAMEEYGLDCRAANLSKYDASGMIEWLKISANAERSPAYAAAAAKAEEDRAIFERALAGDKEARAALGW